MRQRIKSEFHKRVGFLPQIGNTKVNEENLCRESEAKKKKRRPPLVVENVRASNFAVALSISETSFGRE